MSLPRPPDLWTWCVITVCVRGRACQYDPCHSTITPAVQAQRQAELVAMELAAAANDPRWWDHMDAARTRIADAG